MTKDEFGQGTITTEISEGVAVISLNRPEVRNALNSQILRAIPEVIASLEENPEVDVLVLTGTDPAFCAGLDLRELGDTGGNIEPEAQSSMSKGPFPERTKPLIGAINGVAVTGGLELALACDFLIASDRAQFADTHARVGVMPGWGLSVLLPQAIGVRRSREMSLTGNYVGAELAASWGLVNRVVPHEDLIGTVLELAADIRSNNQQGVRQMLQTYESTTSVTLEEGWDVEAKMGREWLRVTNFRPEDVAERRANIQNRGRSQSQS
ncbi:MAG: enoyl-CoA hydratase [Acidimicrobiaceae bacterium]|jgi:enoyl-CoA hydratase|nr:enoyl-CoA hydratase [Acidimicrobiaceae bacterium]HCK75001.1 enoyl-CoA hydratase [Acidimicrobiaceae bacterium]|tara:strand:+ start:309 stop:1109 length:801 start_codon:yes stop_codon:yes gene_type:complete